MAAPSKNERTIQGATNMDASGGFRTQAVSPQQHIIVQNEELEPLVVHTNTKPSKLASKTGDNTQTYMGTPEITSISKSAMESAALIHDDQDIMKRTAKFEEKTDQSSNPSASNQSGSRSRGSQKIDKKHRPKSNAGEVVPFNPLSSDPKLEKRAVKDWEQRGGWASFYFFLILVSFCSWIVFPARFQASWKYIHITKCINDKCYNTIVDWFVIAWSVLWGMSFIHVFVLWWSDYGVKLEIYNPTILKDDAGDDD